MATRRQFDIVWIEKEALPWFPARLERWLLRGTPYVLDFDDAVFHSYDLHRAALVRHLLGQRLDYLTAGSSLVVAGNRYLERRAISAGAKRVEVVPTVVDISRYPAFHGTRAIKPRIVWIGSPSTTRYLEIVAEPLRALAARIPFTFRVIGGGPIEIPGVELEIVQWSTETEAQAISECDVGIMPLEDSPWERGKCAYKLIQYMACGLPTVASPVGANLSVTIEGDTGYFASNPSAWVTQLEILLRDSVLRERMGSQGRLRVEQHYCVQQTAPKLLSLLSELTETQKQLKVSVEPRPGQ
jgi:glycosyltransferase involved in cell wall biosynthesis